MAKLDFETAENIRAQYATGLYSYSQLAAEHGVHRQTIAAVLKRRIYTGRGRKARKVSAKKQEALSRRRERLARNNTIRALKAEGGALCAIGDLYGLSESGVSRICAGQREKQLESVKEASGDGRG